MKTPRVSQWTEAPEIAIPEPPAICSDSYVLWLAYETAGPSDERFAIVRFSSIIDHRLSPINDEGLGQHPYAKAGLKWYSFNEVIDSNETQRWSSSRARHWVITFKDNTLDVVARTAEIVARDVQAPNAMAALLKTLPHDA